MLEKLINAIGSKVSITRNVIEEDGTFKNYYYCGYTLEGVSEEMIQINNLKLPLKDENSEITSITNNQKELLPIEKKKLYNNNLPYLSQEHVRCKNIKKNL